MMSSMKIVCGGSWPGTAVGEKLDTHANAPMTAVSGVFDTSMLTDCQSVVVSVVL